MTTKLIRFPALPPRCGYTSKDTYYRLIKEGKFPAPVRLAGGRAVAWRESDIDRWIEEQGAVQKQGGAQ